MKQPKTLTVDEALEQWQSFDTILDARTPAEFLDDHLPGAANAAVLSDEERITIGTIYKQVSAFEAKKRGAALTARNIAAYIENQCLERARDWRPLVYCWRGGNRSGSLAIILAQIGFPVTQLEGGYKAFRARVMQDLTTLPKGFQFVVLCGTTGSGKSRVLETIAAQGAQTLDLEALANHRGSVLGPIPNKPQPSQRHFETLLWSALKKLDPRQPVFVECESKKVGNVRVPEELMLTIRSGQCIVIDSTIQQRVALLRRDYPHWESDFNSFADRMQALEAALGKDKVQTLLQKSQVGLWNEVVETLLVDHYDPAYLKSIHRNFKDYETAQTVVLSGIDDASLQACARQIISTGPATLNTNTA